jgi:uncharacterized protein involved in exopolysaccharide biosynthesis
MNAQRNRADQETTSGGGAMDSGQPQDSAYEVRLYPALSLLARYRTVLIALPILAGAIVFGLSYLLPKSYTAAAKILPPQQSQTSAAAALFAQLGGASAPPLLAMKNPAELYVAMLESRTIADALIERFSLKTVYGEQLLTDARRKLANRTDIRAARSGVIEVRVQDRDPERAAALANAYAAQLEKLALELAVTEAAQRRLFFEKQLQKVRADMSEAELALARYQQHTGLINPGGQANVTVTAAAALRAQITAKEVQLNSLRTFATEDNADYRRVKSEVSALYSQLARLEGRSTKAPGDLLVPIDAAPKASMDYARLYRDIKYQETLLELVAKQYELARIEEAKESVVIQLLDKAVPPERKSWPKRGLLSALAWFVTLVGLAAYLSIGATIRYHAGSRVAGSAM